MKKVKPIIVVFFIVTLWVQGIRANDSFKFPLTIKFKLLKNDRVVGSCQLTYKKKTDKPGVSSLRMENFQGLGFTNQELLITYIFSKDSSLGQCRS